MEFILANADGTRCASCEPSPKDADFPRPLEPVDDLSPTTVITHVVRQKDGKLLVRGTTADDGIVKKVLVNGQAARTLTPNYSEWEVILPSTAGADRKLQAQAEDAAGNIEPRPHVVTLSGPR